MLFISSWSNLIGPQCVKPTAANSAWQRPLKDIQYAQTRKRLDHQEIQTLLYGGDASLTTGGHKVWLQRSHLQNNNGLFFKWRDTGKIMSCGFFSFDLCYELHIGILLLSFNVHFMMLCHIFLAGASGQSKRTGSTGVPEAIKFKGLAQGSISEMNWPAMEFESATFWSLAQGDDPWTHMPPLCLTSWLLDLD